jgi:xanthine dehydrogenase YagS FAD-binding subunit
MNRFAIAQPRTFSEASQLLLDKRFSLPIVKAGGMDVLDHLKEGLIAPDLLIDIHRLKQDGHGESIFLSDGVDRSAELHIEATATLTEIVESGLVHKHAPVLAQALDHAATLQVRNVGTAAGNLLQRPRCWYYRNDQFDCLKKGGPTCYAVNGENRYHAIFGDGPCHIVHASNLAPAMFVCDAVIHLTGGKRDSLPIAELYHMPDKGVRSEHNLEPGEIITHITLRARPASGFYSIKEKQSFDWPVAMCAAALDLDGATIKSAKLCAGAVAPVPWPLTSVEQALRGASVDDDTALRKACDLSVEGAKPMSDNGYKLKLLPVAVRRAILRAAGKKMEV